MREYLEERVVHQKSERISAKLTGTPVESQISRWAYV